VQCCFYSLRQLKRRTHAAHMTTRPNILYLHSHDTGRYVQPYGYAVATPCLQRFAEQAVLFRHAFSVAPTCSPSRAGLLTGMYPHSCGVHGLTNPPWSYKLRNPSHLLMQHLADAGYETALGGVQHIAARTLEAQRAVGYQTFLNEDDLGEDVPDLEARVARFLSERSEGGPPWFLSIGFDETHRNNRQGDPASGSRFSKLTAYDPESLDSRYCRAPAIFPDHPKLRQDMASYAEGVRRLDERMGHVLDALEKTGLASCTLVIVTTDHGLAWPGIKGNLSDHGTGVMLMLRQPGSFDGGRVIDAMVTHLDVFPTICEAAGLPVPAWIEGKSLRPLARGSVESLHDMVFAEQGWHEVADPQRSVRTARYRYVRRWERKGPKLLNTDEGPAKKILATMGWFEREQGPEQLFDLFLDPLERCNLAGRPEMAAVQAELGAALRDWMERTGDPLLHGAPVPPPG
jgi:arylsulfatase A-like enzyme